MNLQDCYTVVYMMGWLVVAVGVVIAIASGMSGGDDSLGFAVFFGGLYLTAFVDNSRLKARLMMLEQEREKK